MIELTIAAHEANALVNHVTGSETELCAILYTNEYKRGDGLVRVLVRDVEIPSMHDYSRKGALEAELRPEFVARVSKRARLDKTGLVFVHSHPGNVPPNFSPVDDEGELHLTRFLSHRNPNATHLAVVISRGGVCARRVGTREKVRVVSLGEDREVLYPKLHSTSATEHKYDRQVRAFGMEGQRAIQQLRVAIVGLGGTGSIVAEQLVHLGVRDFILIDPDVVDETNLNRIANATINDIGTGKVDVARRYLVAMERMVKVETITGDIVRERYAHPLLNADLIFGCTDSHGSRAVIQQIAYQYLIPCIDVGSTIVVSGRKVAYMIGRVQMLTPGLGCFTCSNLLDPNEVRRDMMSDVERKVDPYLQGAREPAPAVMSINGTVASLGVTMFLSHVAHIPAPGRHLIYDALASKLRSVMIPPADNCFNCSKTGGYARAGTRSLRVRSD